MKSVILDGLLIGVPVLLVALGFRRGVQREAVTLIGILLGALLAELWGPVWGPLQAGRFEGRVEVAQSFVSMGLLLFSAYFIGYGGAVLLPPKKTLVKTHKARLFGLIGGGLNGMLLIGLLLRYASLPYGEGQIAPQVALTRLGPALTMELPRIMLAIVLSGALIVIAQLVILLLRRLHHDPEKEAKKAEAKKAAAPPPEPKVTETIQEAKAPTPEAAYNPILRDLLLQESKKKS